MVAYLVHSDWPPRRRSHSLQGWRALNPLLETFWKNVPPELDKTIENSTVSVNVKELLPKQHGYYTYSGSLTTPPCAEGAIWYVLKPPATLSDEQPATVMKLYPHDNRPIQQLNHREVLESK